MGRIVLLLALSLAWLPAGVSAAEHLRCGGKLVSVGDYKLDVLKKCGDPDLTESRDKEVTHRVYDPKRKVFRELSETVHVDDWTYNFGPNRFFYIVRFVDGRVTDIESGGFGY